MLNEEVQENDIMISHNFSQPVLYFFSAWFSKQDPCFSNLSVVSGEFSRFVGSGGWTKGVWCCFLFNCSSQPWRTKNHTSGAVLWWQIEGANDATTGPCHLYVCDVLWCMSIATAYEDRRMQICNIPCFPSWLSSTIWKQEALIWTPGTHQVKR